MTPKGANRENIMNKDNQNKNASGRQARGINSASRNLLRGGADMTSKRLSVYLRTFGCQMDAFTRDDFGIVQINLTLNS